MDLTDSAQKEDVSGEEGRRHVEGQAVEEVDDVLHGVARRVEGQEHEGPKLNAIAVVDDTVGHEERT